MPATVHFATNRVLDGPPDDVASYSESVVAPSNPNEVTYGTAFVNDANLTADTIGAITSIQTIGQGQFSQSAIDDLSDPGRNLLVFIHGFDNSFENAITRAAFNQQWFAASGLQQAETSVVAFSWPSRRQADQPALPQRRLSPRPDHGRPVGPAHHDLLRQPRADHHQRARQGQSRLPADAQHGQLGAAGGGGELVRPRQRRCLPVRRGLPRGRRRDPQQLRFPARPAG